MHVAHSAAVLVDGQAAVSPKFELRIVVGDYKFLDLGSAGKLDVQETEEVAHAEDGAGSPGRGGYIARRIKTAGHIRLLILKDKYKFGIG